MRGDRMRFLAHLGCALGLAVLGALLPVSTALGSPGAASSADVSVDDYPTEMPPIDVAVVRDGLDPGGQWVQTVRLTIRAGGTLADASLVAFGDLNHVDTVFQAAQTMNPHLVNPAMIPVGQQIDLQINPSTTFVLAAVLHGPNTTVQRFTNGVVNTVYAPPRGSVRRLMTFPAGRPTDFFVYAGATGPVKVRPGGRLVDLQYVPGQSFADVVQQTYGVTTYHAAVDLVNQTGWDPTRWPPAAGAQKRVITEPASFYLAVPREAPLIENPNPIGRARQEELHRQRLQAGVYAVRSEGFSTIYHVAVTDPSVTASSLSYLIYGSTAHQADVARAAGYPVSATGAGPGSFDPHLLGRSFDLQVDYQDEQFVYAEGNTADGGHYVALVNGATILRYPSQTHGLIEMVTYPTGYKRLLYRPSNLSLLLAQGLGLFHVASDLNLPGEAANAIAREYAARVIWHWSPGMPRAPGDIPDSARLIDDPAGPIVEVLIGPPAPTTPVTRLIQVLETQNPLVAIAGLVALSAAAVMVVDLGRRAIQRRPAGPWSSRAGQ